MWAEIPKPDTVAKIILAAHVGVRLVEKLLTALRVQPSAVKNVQRARHLLNALTCIKIMHILKRRLDSQLYSHIPEFVPIGHITPSFLEQLKMYVCRKKAEIMIFALRLINRYNASTVSSLIENATTRMNDTRKDLLRVQSNIKVFPMASSSIHSHPVSAMWRTGINAYLTNVVQDAGFKPYHVSRSNTDTGAGSRYFYFVKDLGIKYSSDSIDQDTAIIMTDVDYYANMNAWLLLNRPILMYTLYPEKASYNNEEYSYYLQPHNNTIRYNVSGGASYEHHLWNYDHDTICTFDINQDLLTYSVEQRKIQGDDNHRIIMILPVARVKYPYGYLIPLQHCGLARRDLTKGYLYNTVTDQLSIMVTEQHSAELTGQLYEAIKQRLLNKKAPPLVSDIERLLRDNGISNHALMAPLLYNYMDVELVRNVIPTTELTTNYLPIEQGSLSTEDGRPGGSSAMSNLVFPGASFPAISESSDLSTIYRRVFIPCNTVVPPRLYNNFADDFIDLVVGNHAGQGTPLALHEVIEQQNGPLQRARIEQVKYTVSLNSGNRLEAFVKNEPYSTPSAPRNITTMAGELTLMLSSFTYAFKRQVLKQHKFYSPGMSPQQICDRLQELTTFNGIVNTDYTKFDGSISEWLQRLVYRIYARWLKQNQIGEFRHWFELVFINKARTKMGVRYNPYWGTRSGSPFTTDGNTMINAFVVFCALRKLRHTKEEAFAALGLYCGDDGYTAYVDGLTEMLITAAKELGLTLDIEHQVTGPYSYCGRRFIDPMLCHDSYQDIKRTLPKLHVVRNGATSLEQRLTNKAAGYLVTDSQTPLIGNWARKVLELTGLEARDLSHEESYKMSFPWPQDNADLIRENVANDLDMTIAELDSMCESIDATTSLDEFPILQEWDPEHKVTCVRSGLLEAVHIVTDDVAKRPDQRFMRSYREARGLGEPKTTNQVNRQPAGSSNLLRPVEGEITRSISTSSLGSTQSTPAIQRKADSRRTRANEDRRLTGEQFAARPERRVARRRYRHGINNAQTRTTQ